MSSPPALRAAVLALLLAETFASSAAVSPSPKLVSHSPSFEEAVVEGVRRGQRRDKNAACLTCCDKGCKTMTGAKKCGDLFGIETGEAAGTQADKTCKADGVICKDDDGCFCVWNYKGDTSKCPEDGKGGRNCKVLPGTPMRVEQSV